MNRTGMIAVGLAAFGELIAGSAQALPQNGQVVAGSATISQTSATQLDITQTSSRTVLDWRSFSIGANETANFHQPSSSSVAVNRVTGVDPSTISGRLNANGQVVLVNPNGILFSQGAQVNVGGIVATTTGISTRNAMAGNFVFDHPGNPGATVVNQGKITAAQGGLVALVAPGVANSGVIRANLGKVSLASGNRWTLDLYGDHLVNFAVDGHPAGEVTQPLSGSIPAGVSNSGKIIASAGTVEITANVAKGIVSNAINMSGIVEASSIHRQGGTIVLDGGNNGVVITGKLAANGTSGGAVRVAGDTITQTGTIDAIGASGLGGAVTIDAASAYNGAGAHISVSGLSGGGSLRLKAGKSITASNAVVTADATGSGKGGDVVVISGGDTGFGGTISARGGSQGGDGGTVETSGETLAFAQTQVDTTAAQGKTGNWLLDPYDLTINSADGTAIGAALGTSNVTLQTTAANTGTSAYGTVTNNASGNISVNGAINWNSANSLTLSAYNSISVAAAITDSGAGNIVLRADNAGRSTGTVAISSSVSVGGTASLYYNPAAYTTPTAYAAGIFHGSSATNAYMLVNSAAQLGQVSTNLGGTYAQGANIATVGTISPIGASGTPFSGLFDGNGGIAAYTLGGVTASSTANTGLFGFNTGTIRNVTVTSGTVSGTAGIGGLVGYNSGTVSASSFTGTVLGGSNAQNVGGLVGYSGFAAGNGTVTATTNVASILAGSVGAGTVFLPGSSATSIGGLVGYNDTGSTISGGTASEAVSGNQAVGGYVGYNAGLLKTVTATNNVTGGSAANTLGGLVGYNAATGTILSATAANTVTAGAGAAYVGGVVGVDNGFASLVSATGYVGVGDSSGTVGGFAGYELGNATGIYINNSVSAGAAIDVIGGFAGYLQYGASGITALGSLIVGTSSSYIGGLAGYDSNSDTSGPATATISNVSISNAISVDASSNYIAGLVGYADTFQTRLTVGSGVTFAGAITAGSGAQFVGGLIGYGPGVIVNNGLVSGNITVGASSLGVGGLVAYNSSNGNSGGGATVVNGTVTGSLFIGDNSLFVGGLVGFNDQGGTVTNGTVGGAISVGSNVQEAGGLVGFNNDTLLNGKVLASASILMTGGSAIGGLVGQNSSQGTINGGSFAGTITGSAGTAIGGVAGYNDGTVTGGTVAASGLVSLTAGTSIGGLVGYNSTLGTITGGTVLGTVSGGANAVGIGGLVGYNGGTIAAGSVAAIVSAGANSFYVGGGVGWNDSGATASGLSVTATVTAGMAGTAVGGIVGLNGSDPRSNTASGAFSAVAAVLSNSLFVGTVGAGPNSFAVGGEAGWNSSWTSANSGTGTAYHGSVTASSGSGSVTAGAGSFQVRTANQIGCDQSNGCAGTAGTDVLTVLASTGQSKIYGDADSGLVFTVSGLKGGDTQSQATSGAQTRATGENVGSYAISQGSLAVNPFNYTISYVGSTFTITPASLAVTATAGQTKIYGGTDPVAYTYSATGLKNGDTTAALSGALARATGQNAGTYAISQGTLADSNYSITYTGSNFVISKAALTISANNASRTYSASNPAFTASYNGLVNADTSAVVSGLTLSTTATTASSVGTYAIAAAGAVASNYTITLTNGTLTVNQAPLTITASNGTRLYGATNPALTASYTGLVNGDTSAVVSGLTLSTTATTSSNIGTYAISALGAAASNYAIALANGTLTVNPAALTITANNGTRLYGGTNPTFTASYNGLVAGDTSAAISGLTLSSTATTSSNIGTYAIAPTGGTDANYTITRVNGSLTVTPAPLTISANNTGKLYGATNPTFTASYNGLVAGDTSAVVSGLTLTSPATTASPVGSYAINAANGTAANYTISYIAGTLTVAQGILTITANSASKLYGAADPTLAYTATGFINGDTSAGITGSLSRTTGANVGTYSITQGSLADSNYVISFTGASFTITPAPLTISAINTSRTYGATNPTLAASYAGLANGDTSTVVSGLTLSTAATTASSTGSYAITAAGAAAANYTISYVAGTLAVTPAVLTISAGSTSRTYGAANPAFTASYAGFVNGDTSAAVSGLTLNTAATTGSSVGTYGITAANGVASNYAITYVAGTLAVTKAALTITANNSSRTYGATNPAFTASYAGLVNSDTSAVVSGLNLSSAATTASNVGSYAISGASGVASNYTLSYVAGTLSVTQAPLTITAANASKTYGATNPVFTASYTGLVAGNTSAVVSGLTLSSAATTASNVGSYAITAAGATAANYAITLVNGTLAVGQAALTISANNASRLYGSTNPAFSAGYTGLLNGDTSAVVSGLLLASAATTASNVGSYGITASGATAANYAISFVGGTLSVTPAPLTITAANAGKTYGTTNPVFGPASYSGLVNGDTSAVVTGLAFTSTATTASSVGTYAISGVSATAANYSISYAAGTLAVTPAALTIAANNSTRFYGAANPAFSASYAGLVAGDTSSVVSGLTLASSATTGSNIGTYAITAGGGTASNYTISFVNGSLAVTPAPLTISASNASRTYGATNPTLTASYSGLVAGDTSSVVNGLSLATAATTASNIGTYAITASGATAANYAITLANGALAVTPASLTITANNASRTFGDSNPTFSATYGGLVNGDTSSVVTGLGLSTAATLNSNAGTYAIAGAGAVASNYAITYVGGSLVVNKAPLTITANNAAKVYGDANPALTASYTGFVAGNTSSVVSGLTLSTVATSAANVGSYAITAANALASNYTISYGTGTLSVTPAPLTITANNASRLYTDTDPTFTASYSGLKLGQTSSVVSGLMLSANDPNNAAAGTNWTITASGAAAANYTISYGTGNLFVGKAYLTITPVDATRVYGSADPAYTATYAGLQSGDTVSGITFTSGANIASGVGQYQLSAANAIAADYIISYNTGILTVTPAPLVIAANNATRAQNQADPAFTASFNGLVAGDSPAVLAGLAFSAGDRPNSPPGSYTLIPFGVINPNYAITYVNGLLTITGSGQPDLTSNTGLAAVTGRGATGSTILAQVISSQVFDVPFGGNINSGAAFSSAFSAPTSAASQPQLQNFLAISSQYLYPTRHQNDQALCLKGGSGGCMAPLMLHGF